VTDELVEIGGDVRPRRGTRPQAASAVGRTTRRLGAARVGPPRSLCADTDSDSCAAIRSNTAPLVVLRDVEFGEVASKGELLEFAAGPALSGSPNAQRFCAPH
jgi:hypothetical protein